MRCGKALSEKDSMKIEPLLKDFLETQVPEQVYKNASSGSTEMIDNKIGVIICDPSCSGSGMKLHATEDGSK